MTKGLLLAALIVSGAEGIAYACSCLSTDDPAELRKLANEDQRKAVALVEAEAVTSYAQTPTGEEMTVVRMLAGTAPSKFRVNRNNFPSDASCDVVYRAGQRYLMLLYVTPWTRDGLPVFSTSGLCTSDLLEKPAFRAEVIRRMGGPPRGAERG